MNLPIELCPVSVADSIKLTVRPQHVIRSHSVEIAISTDISGEVHYHFISPERALSLLALLEQERDILEQMVKGQEG
jgi:hypothetical protein